MSENWTRVFYLSLLIGIIGTSIYIYDYFFVERPLSSQREEYVEQIETPTAEITGSAVQSNLTETTKAPEPVVTNTVEEETPGLDLEHFAFAPGYDSKGKSIYNQSVVGPAIIKVSDSANDIVVLGLGVKRDGLSGILWQYEANCPHKAERALKANYPSPLGQISEYFYE